MSLGFQRAIPIGSRACVTRTERCVLLALSFLPCAAAAQSPGVWPSADTVVVRATSGTALVFDLTPDGRSLIMDLLGQLWILPLEGGPARLLHDTVALEADDRQPAISPDGRWIATRSDRAEARGIWLHGVGDEPARAVADSGLILGRDIAAPSWAPAGDRLAYVDDGQIVLVDPATKRREPLRIDALGEAILETPVWGPDGRRLLVGARSAGASVTAIWEVDVATGQARRITPEGITARAPAWAPDGLRIAYFATDAEDRHRLVVQPLGGELIDIVTTPGIEPLRVRWTNDGRSLVFVSGGRLHRVPAAGGEAVVIPFSAELRLPRARYARTAPHLPEPGAVDSARGFSGLAIAPDGQRIAMLALGSLWLIDLQGAARAVASVPASANGLAWSPDGTRVAWSDGPLATQDLWVLELATGRTRRVTRSGGSDSRAAWSPGGRHLAFLHNDGHVHVVSGDAQDEGTEVVGPEAPFGEIAAFSEVLQWTPAGDTLLIYGMDGWPVATPGCVRALLAPLEGTPKPVERFPCRPSHVRLGADGTLIAIEDGVLTERRRTADGWAEPHRVGGEAALHPSLSRDGTLLYVAADGLRVREPTGEVRRLGWPVRFRAPVPPPVLIRNVRLVPLEPGSDSSPRDVLLGNGRFVAIAPAGTLADVPADATVLDAGGRWAIPGLIDAHTHFLWTGLASVRAALYHGVTTVREMWHPLAESAAFRDDVAAGVLAGPNIVVSGPPFYPSPPMVGSVTSDFLWIPVDSATTDRGLTMLRAFGAGHVKMRYTQTWSAAAAFLRRAHAFGLPAGGHCAHTIAAVAAGVDTHEHADGQCGDWQFGIHEDLAQLYGAAGVAVVPVIDIHDETVRIARDSLRLQAPEVRAFRGGLRAEEPVSAIVQRRLEARAQRARANARLLHDAGVRLVAGADADGLPGGLPRELAALVRAGLSPAQALAAATVEAAAVLGLEHEIGRIALGMRADLVLLEGNPLDDIRHVGRIHRIIHVGRIVDRAALLAGR